VAGYQNRARTAFYAAEAGIAEARRIVRFEVENQSDNPAFPTEAVPRTLADAGLFDRENGQLPRYFGDPQDALAEERCGVAAAQALCFARKGLSGGASLGVICTSAGDDEGALAHRRGGRADVASRVSVLESKVMTLAAAGPPASRRRGRAMSGEVASGLARWLGSRLRVRRQRGGGPARAMVPAEKARGEPRAGGVEVRLEPARPQPGESVGRASSERPGRRLGLRYRWSVNGRTRRQRPVLPGKREPRRPHRAAVIASDGTLDSGMRVRAISTARAEPGLGVLRRPEP
jgi:hypothetical protein